MIEESFDFEEPVCPYCKSEDWTAYYGKPMDFRYEDDCCILSFECKCKDCGKKFYENRFYIDSDMPEYFPIEESE